MVGASVVGRESVVDEDGPVVDESVVDEDGPVVVLDDPVVVVLMETPVGICQQKK